MNISISKELAERIERKVESGYYPSADAVIDKALELLDDHDQELRALIQEGIEALESGDYVEYTDENLHEFFEDVHRRGLERLKTRDESINA
jgi:putative addiction module CopG family antidote